jgi:hypothetical protein
MENLILNKKGQMKLSFIFISFLLFFSIIVVADSYDSLKEEFSNTLTRNISINGNNITEKVNQYKTKSYNDNGLILIADTVESCSWKPDNIDDGYKTCNSIIEVYNNGTEDFNLKSSKQKFKFELSDTSRVKNSKYTYYYSTTYITKYSMNYDSSCEKENGIPIPCINVSEKEWLDWKEIKYLDINNIKAKEVVAFKVVYEIPKYSSNSYNFTLIGTTDSASIDPDVSACGTLDTDNGIYTLAGILGYFSYLQCILISGNNITFNMNNYAIALLNSSESQIGIKISGLNSTITNGHISGGIYGIWIADDANNSLIKNMLITHQKHKSPGDGTGIMLDSAINTTLDNVTIGYNSDKEPSHCIYFRDLDSPSFLTKTLYGNNLYCYADSSAIYSTSNNVILAELSDSIINVAYPDNAIISITSSSVVYFTNVTYFSNASEVPLNNNATIFRKWYYTANVTDKNGNYLQDAAVNITNSSFSNVFSSFTDSNGKTNKTTVIEYIKINGTNVYQTPHTINISKTGYFTNSSIYNLSISNNVYESVSLFTVNPPNITINSPLNQSYNVSSILFNVTSIDDDSEVSSCWFSLNNGVTNYTLTSSGNNNFNYTNSSVNQGSTTAIFYCNDSINNINSSSVTFFIDSIIPQINFISSTENNNSNLSRNYIYANVSLTETNFANITYSLYNSTSLVNQTTYTSKITEINWTSLTNEYYWYNVSTLDTTNNYNSTETRKITLDTFSPSISISSPSIATNSSNVNLDILYNSNDLNLDSCWYSNDSFSVNITLAGCSNITSVVWSQGTHVVTIWSNDSSNNINSSTTNFVIDSINPNATLIIPSNNYYSNSSSNNFTVNITDNIGLQNSTLTIYNSSDYIVNQTSVSYIDNPIQTLTGIVVSLADGIYKWFYSIFDFTGNNYATENNTLTIDTSYPLISITSPSNNTNSSDENLDINYTVSDTNLVSCWYSNDSYSINTSLTCGQNITAVVWNDGVHNVTIWSNDSAGNINFSSISFNIDTTAPTISIFSPESKNYPTNESLELNLTVTDSNVGVDSVWYQVKKGATIVIDNTSIPLNTNTTFSVEGGDNDFTIIVYSNDSINNINSEEVEFGVRMNSPTITLNSPVNGKWFNNNSLYINFTPFRSIGIDTCKLYSNFTGNWAVNYTWVSPENNTMNSTLFILLDNYYLYNIWCNDSLGSEGFALNNETFGVDTIYPEINITTTNSSSFPSLSFNINYNITDLNINDSYFTLRNSTGDLHNYAENTTLNYSLNSISLSTLVYGTFILTIYGKDKAGNLNSSEIYITTYKVSSTGGGGGGITIIGTNETQWIMTTSSGGGAYKLITIPGTEREFFILLQNLGTSPRSITLRCEDVDGTFCQYVKFENTSISLPAINNFTTAVKFTITTPNDVTTQTQLFNIRGKDDLGLDGILTVETSGAGILISVTSKLLSNKIIAGLKIPYLVISLVIWTVLSFILSLLIKDKKDNKNIGLSVLISLVLTFIILAFI